MFYFLKKHTSRWLLALIAVAIFIILSFLLWDYFISRIRFPRTGNIPVTPYVSAIGTKLYVGGEPYQFTGVNAFHLGTFTPANTAGCGGQENDLNAFFSQLRPNSIVRMWAFQGSITTNVTTKQIDWTGLDRVVSAAENNDMKLILTLSDQSGTCDDGHWKDKSWYESGFREAPSDPGNGLTPIPYLDYVKLVVTRYKDSTAIAMWEPVNEPQASDCVDATGNGCYAKLTCPNEQAAAQAMRSFFDTVGGEIKSIDKNHLVSSGVIGDGQCGAVFEDYKYLHQSPGIDVASYHDYGREDQAMPGDQWNGLQKRLNQMKLINKPLIIGEVGMVAMDNSTNCINLATRRDRLKAKMDAQFQAGIAGFIPWASGGVSPICNYNIGDNDPTLALLRDYPVPMGKIRDRQAPTAPTNLTATLVPPTQVYLTWDASVDNVGVTRYDIFRNDAYLTSTTGTSFTNANLHPSTTYAYHVKSKDAAINNSASSNRVTIMTAALPTPTPTPTPDRQAPSAPTNLTATAISPTRFTLSWTPSIDNVAVIRYDIFRNDAYFTSTTGTTITFTLSNTYTYHVKGKDAVGNNSVSSNRVTIGPLPTPFPTQDPTPTLEPNLELTPEPTVEPTPVPTTQQALP